MSTYNITTGQESSFGYNPDWNSNPNIIKSNQKYSYNFLINAYVSASYSFILEPITYFNSTIHSSIKSSILANIWSNPNILLSRPGMPIHNSAEKWRLK